MPFRAFPVFPFRTALASGLIGAVLCTSSPLTLVPFVPASAPLLAQGAPPPAPPTGPSGPEDSPPELNGQLPKAQFPKVRLDLGEMWRGQKVQRAFEFTNTGTGALHIRSIHAACGCLTPKVEPRDIIQPGEKGRVVFEFDSSHFSGDLVRNITLDTNMLNPSALTLTITANIRQEISAKPSLLNLGNSPKTSPWPLSIPVTLWAKAPSSFPDTLPARLDTSPLSPEAKAELTRSSDLRVVTVTTSTPSLAAEWIPTGKEGGLVKVSLKGPLPVGPLRERISVWNNSRHLKELVIPVIGEVAGNFQLSSSYFEFGVLTGNAVTRKVSISSTLPNLEVTSVGLDLKPNPLLGKIRENDLAVTQLEKTRDGWLAQLTLRTPSALASAIKPVNVSGVFVIRTNDPDQKDIRIPFFGIYKLNK